MKRVTITSKNGYDIPCLHTLTGNEKKAVIVMHGFGSSKESPTARMLARQLPKEEIGTFAFDFPAHGESPVDGSMLSLSHCMDDLAAAEKRVLELAPGAELYYFGSSFGAYITLLYLAERNHSGKKAFLRSAAVEMPKLFHNKTEEEQKSLAENGFVLLDQDYVRPLKLTKAFFDDLDSHDVFQLYRAGEAKVFMVHGSDDETAPLEAVVKFSEEFGAELAVITGGDHRLSLPGMPEKVLELTLAFFELSHF